MDKTALANLQEFCAPWYDAKDEMHGMGHIGRVLALARDLAREESLSVEEDLMVIGAYLHGFVYQSGVPIRDFLASFGLDALQIDRVVQIAWESQKESHPQTSEGACLHDAHLIEGGRYFGIAKSLVTGTARGQSLRETLAYMEKEQKEPYGCVLPQAQKVFLEKQRMTREFVAELRESLYETE